MDVSHLLIVEHQRVSAAHTCSKAQLAQAPPTDSMIDFTGTLPIASIGHNAYGPLIATVNLHSVLNLLTVTITNFGFGSVINWPRLATVDPGTVVYPEGTVNQDNIIPNRFCLTFL